MLDEILPLSHFSCGYTIDSMAPMYANHSIAIFNSYTLMSMLYVNPLPPYTGLYSATPLLGICLI